MFYYAECWTLVCILFNRNVPSISWKSRIRTSSTLWLDSLLKFWFLLQQYVISHNIQTFLLISLTREVNKTTLCLPRPWRTRWMCPAWGTLWTAYTTQPWTCRPGRNTHWWVMQADVWHSWCFLLKTLTLWSQCFPAVLIFISRKGGDLLPLV